MDRFVFLLKTYEKDLEYSVRLIKSFQKYNIDSIRMYVILPKKDIERFESLLGDEDKQNIFIKAEEVICPYLVDKPVGGINAGYINQEIIKLSFWETKVSENYFCLDSEAVFIREFGYRDFIGSNGFPYTVLIEDKGLKSDPIYYREFWIEREKSIKKILRELDMDDYKYLTCHGFQTFNASVLQSFKTEFMEKKRYNYSDILKISPYEFSWYNFYLQKTKAIPINASDEIFKTFHIKEQYVLSCLKNIKIEDLSRAYVGIVINSNFVGGKKIEYGEIDNLHIRVSHKVIMFVIKERINMFFCQILKFVKRIL